MSRSIEVRILKLFMDYVSRAYQCIYSSDDPINPDGILSSANTYLKCAIMLLEEFKDVLKDKKLNDELRKAVEMLRMIMNYKYEVSRFQKVWDKKLFERKYAKVRQHARSLLNKLKYDLGILP